ncbi:hypothetical protein PY650_18455 [Rhizobium calliandrae]|uniref:Uncharacterized protein n=1 Tax=Rhizobium calliandrae TaxID=1312182 RepID=A0ABT7KG71_9HYPH|nr:hypothetical protein [Rhizobium calliandrae]MDL2407610.1 hypothetical protein [Rhizobium calliandrae]
MSEIALKVFSNADDVHLVWLHQEDIVGCLAFAIQCKRDEGEPKFLSNRAREGRAAGRFPRHVPAGQ